MPSPGVSAVLHLSGIVSFSLSFKYLSDDTSYISDTYGWHWKFLTILGLAVSYATFVSGLIADITLSPLPFYIKNKLALLSTPLEALITILYWGLFVIDKNLVVHPDLSISLPADIGFHAMPSIFLLTDFIFFSPPWDIRFYHALGMSSAIAVSYWAWVEHCYSYNGFYPYPIFELLNTIQRVYLFTASAVMMTISAMIIQCLYNQINKQSKSKGNKIN
ncbi:hypothetical protein K3495_g5119 [Podosphaera aphanis]|nr:hypothetical protein K3495_g5119 [Podosphaera aphanis]